MKKAFNITIALIVAMVTALVSVMIMPAFSFVTDESEGQISGGFIYDEPVKLLIAGKTNSAGNLKGAGNDYELPFIPVETKHDWDNGTVTTPPTCTEPGVKTYTCKLNLNHTKTEEIPATGHTPAEAVIENEVLATCSVAGSYDEVVYCSVCHEEVSREQKTSLIDEDMHDWGEWVQTKAPTETEPGEETRTCKYNPNHTETREINALGPSQIELSFLDDEVIIVVPRGAIPDGSEFDVQKIVPPPAEIVEMFKDQTGSSSEVISYYEIRLNASDGTSIIYLDGEITIKTKMPEQYVGSEFLRILQEDETGELIVMESSWEDQYLCYKTDWLEIYN